MRIYISGPIRGNGNENIEANVQKGIDAALAVYKRGHVPFCPHLQYYMALRDKIKNEEQGEKTLQWEDFMLIDWAWVLSCEGLLYLAPSPGADLELGLAKRLGKQVFTDIEQVPVIERPPPTRDMIERIFTPPHAYQK